MVEKAREVDSNNRQILKYPLRITGSRVCTVQMPRGAKPLSVGAQAELGLAEERVQLWAWSDLDQPLEPRRFILLMTGDADYLQQDAGQFLGTVLLSGGMYVLHIFTHPDDD